MKIVVAPDSFKECMEASEAASVIADEIRRRHPGWSVVELPLSDGGEGFTEIASELLQGKLVPLTVTGPMGEATEACYARVGETAVMAVSSACGLGLVPPGRRNPLLASSRGMGEMILSAFNAGCRKFFIGLGGTATCDGGEGMMSVPGVKEISGKISITALCDVTNPFLGPDGAARVFAPQKGADPAMMEIIENRMASIAGRILEETNVDVSHMPGAGAAGGMAGALAAYFGADILPGINALLDMAGYGEIVADADLVITGEGCSDRQTLAGKVPLGVLKRSGTVPVVLLSGRIRDRKELLEAGFRALCQVTPDSVPLSEALKKDVAESLLRKAVAGTGLLQLLEQ